MIDKLLAGGIHGYRPTTQFCPHCFTDYRREKPMCSCEAKNAEEDFARERHLADESNKREDR